MIPFLLVTAFTVSIDSFVCGFSLSKDKQNKFLIVLIIALTVFLMCLITNYSAIFFSDILNEKNTWIGGAILTLIGIYNLIKKEDNSTHFSGTFSEAFLSGFAVGLDGSIANLSLALMGINSFYVPVVIALMHAIMVSLGIILQRLSMKTLVKRFDFIPPLILVGLGIYKIVFAFL